MSKQAAKLITSLIVSAVLSFGLAYLGGIQAGGSSKSAAMSGLAAALASIVALLKESPLVDLRLAIETKEINDGTENS